MCGIVGYIGTQQALPILLDGLRALEYRGYDSAGVSLCHNNTVWTHKERGDIATLVAALDRTTHPESTVGLGHTRWATHGAPSTLNAHPHTDCTGRISIVHNGIIENYQTLKQKLRSKGHVFASETDSEVIAHLIEDLLREETDTIQALRKALHLIEGTYALGVLDATHPDHIYAARSSSPLVIGVAQDARILASDPAALVGSTKDVVYLQDGEIADITADTIDIISLNDEPQSVLVERLEWDLEQAQKGDFPHFMLKEIFEGPEVVRTSMRGRLKPDSGLVKLGGLDAVADQLRETKRILILACGTSYYAGLVGEYVFEEIAQLPVEVRFASEFRYRNEPFEPGTAALAISQSGETADTLAALRKARASGLLTLGLVNTVGSTIARETDAGVYNHAGPEIGVASTKAFLSQLTILHLMALYMARTPNGLHHALAQELDRIPEKIQSILDRAEDIRRLALRYASYENFLFLGRRYNFPVALEGALKLKEISYRHAEGYSAGEMKHGPIALINPDFPTIAVAPRNSVSDKMYSNIEEIRSRKGPILAVATEGDDHIRSLADDVFWIPETLEPLEPLLSVIPLQLLAYYVGTELGYNVDKPRNLAKSVTVE